MSYFAGYRRRRDTFHTTPPNKELPNRYVYFARKPFSRMTKIGLSENVPQRMAALKCYEIATIERPWFEAHRLEKALHKHFAHARVKGEWFLLTVEEIASVL